jgi:hypothetical protein
MGVDQPDDDAPAAALEVQDGGQVVVVPDLPDGVELEVRLDVDAHTVAAAAEMAPRLTAAFAALGAALAPMAAAVPRILAELEAAGIDPQHLAALEPLPPAQHCGCLCPLHRADGMNCEGEATWAVQLVGGAIELDRPHGMCGWCAAWWQRAKPERVARAMPLVIDGEAG